MIGLKKKTFKKYLSLFLATGVLLSNSQVAFANVNNEGSILQNQNPWNLVWSDEFNGTSLNESNWSYDVGNWIVDESGNGVAKGWGNDELEYYTPGDNISFKDGNLVITAKKEQKTDKFGTYDYTSSKIKTKDKVTTKYGRIEARMQLPEGSGLWPAFWMMPNDDVYGSWASSGELDIMEARGYEPNTVEGTIHYGSQWPNNKSTGNKGTIPNGGKISEFHEYAVEWEPGEIRWYIDGKLFSTQNNWNSTAANGEKYSFPAPFDQDFYIILNLAIGGWFVEKTEPSEDFQSAEMLVDYVRVYEKPEEYTPVSKEPVVNKEPLPEGAYEAIDGNYIYDTNYETGFVKMTSEPPFEKKWYFLTGFNGSGDIINDSVDGKEFAKVTVANGGEQPYAIQLIQYLTLTKGHSYKVSFDAKSSTNREMSVKLGSGSGRNWSVYSDNFKTELTSDIKHYEYVFDMTADSDVNARLEFNMGLNTNPIWIGNVKVEEYEKTVNYDGPKEPLKDGNYVYNGTFDKGLINRLTYWNLIKANGTDAKYSVAEDTRELFVDVVNGGTNASDIVIEQRGIKLAKDSKYELTFKARANSEKTVKIVIKNDNDEVVFEKDEVIGTSMAEHKIAFDVPISQANLNGKFEMQLGGNNTEIYLDDVFLKNTAAIDTTGMTVFPLKNGDFSQGLTGWDYWTVVGAQFTTEDGKTVINMPNKFWDGGDGAETWAVQFIQKGLQIYKGLEYVVSFDASSTIEREFELVAQNSSYNRHFQKKVTIGTESKRYTYSFVPEADDTVELNFLLGKFGDYEPHSVNIDNVVFEVKNPTTNKVQNNKFDDGDISWNKYAGEGGEATESVVDGVYNLDINNIGTQFWNIQLQQNGLTLEKGKSYRLVFDMASSIGRKIQAVVENQGYTKALDKIVSINEELNTYTLDFVYDMDTDTNMRLNFCLGAVEGQDTSIGAHTVTLDNVYLYEIPDLSVTEPEAPKTITTMVPTEGPIINVKEDGGCGFTFPNFNDGASKFDDVKDDLEVLVKENGVYVNIDSEDYWTYNENWGHFWNDLGGYWFKPVTETTYVKLTSKTNPNVAIEYTLKVEGSDDNNSGTDGTYEVNKVSDTEAEFVLYKDGVKEGDQVLLLVKINGSGEAGYPMSLSGGNKFTYKIPNLKDGDQIEYRFNAIIDGAGKLIEGCPTYTHTLDEAANNVITSMEVTQGPLIDVGADGGCGFTFPKFNDGTSNFKDVEKDLAVFVKENGEYIEIGTSSKFIYDTNWGHFWDGPGGYWFNPVNETTNIKLVSKSNPDVFIEYTLKVPGAEEPEAPKVISKMEVTEGPVIDVEKGKGTGFTFPTFNGGLSKFDHIKDDLVVLVKENNEYIEIGTSSKFIYDTNWGHFWDGPGGYWFNPVNETTYIKLVSKSNPTVFIEHILLVKADKIAADAVISKINALPESIKLENKEDVETARSAYNALTDAQKYLVSSEVLAKLKAAEVKIVEADIQDQIQNNESIEVKPTVNNDVKEVTINKDTVDRLINSKKDLLLKDESASIDINSEVLNQLVGQDGSLKLQIQAVNQNILDIIPVGINSLGNINLNFGNVTVLNKPITVRINYSRTRMLTRSSNVFIYAFVNEELKLVDDKAIIENGYITFNTKILGNIVATDKLIDGNTGGSTGGGTITPPTNMAPSISASDVVLKVGENFNPLTGVTANDKEDGVLTSKIKVIENTVDTTKAGVYKVVYQVTDNNGATITKEIKVTVEKLPNKVPVITANDITMKIGEVFNVFSGVMASDEEDGDITSKITVILNTVKADKEGNYTVMYKVVDSKGASVIKTISVNVKGKLTVTEIHVKAHEATLNAMDKKSQSAINEARAYINGLKESMPDNSDISTWSAMLDSIQYPIYVEVVNQIVALNKKLEKGDRITQEEVNKLRILLENNIEDTDDNIPTDYLVGCGWSEYTDRFQMSIANSIVNAILKAEAEKTKESVDAARVIVEDMLKSIKPDMVKWAKLMEARLNKVEVK